MGRLSLWSAALTSQSIEGVPRKECPSSKVMEREWDSHDQLG